jgi:hypothetical protein
VDDAALMQALHRRDEPGMSPEEARREALRRLSGSDLGEVSQRLQRSAEQREVRHRSRARLDALRQDVRYGLRRMRSEPRFGVFAMLRSTSAPSASPPRCSC